MLPSASLIRVVLFAIACLGGLFFTIGIIAPGWEITNNGAVHKGIWFTHTCYTQTGACLYVTPLEKYNTAKKERHFSWSDEYIFSMAVGDQVLAMISLLSLYLGIFFAFIVFISNRFSNLAMFMAAPCFFTSAALIWTHIGQEGAAVRAANLLREKPEATPYSMVLCGFGSSLTMGVAVTYLVYTVRLLLRLPVEKYEQF